MRTSKAQQQADEIDLWDSDDEGIQYAVSQTPDLETARWLIVFLGSQWTISSSKEISTQGILNNTLGFHKRPVAPKIRVITDQVDAIPDIRDTFESHQLVGWLNHQVIMAPQSLKNFTLTMLLIC